MDEFRQFTDDAFAGPETKYYLIPAALRLCIKNGGMIFMVGCMVDYVYGRGHSTPKCNEVNLTCIYYFPR